MTVWGAQSERGACEYKTSCTQCTPFWLCTHNSNPHEALIINNSHENQEISILSHHKVKKNSLKSKKNFQIWTFQNRCEWWRRRAKTRQMFWLTFEVVQKAASGHKFIAKNPLISLRGITQESHKVWAVELMRNHSNFSAKFSLSLHRKPWQSLHCNWSSITELPYVHCSKSSSPYQCVCTEICRCSRQFFQCEDLHWWSVVWQFCILHWWSTLWRRISTWLAKTRSKDTRQVSESLWTWELV